MNFNKHFNLEGRHAFLSASKYHWINYDEEKLIAAYQSHLAVQRGTDLHELAKQCILLGVRLPKSKKTLNMYVNDAIGFQMTPEQPLYYSENCFGTTDAIAFKNNFLRIHDFKSGVTPAHMEQLYIYESLFCLEYDVDPYKIDSELRIYQSDEILIDNPSPDDIRSLMDKIIFFDKRLSMIQEDMI